VRRLFWFRELVQRAKELREEYPRWGKDKSLFPRQSRGLD